MQLELFYCWVHPIDAEVQVSFLEPASKLRANRVGSTGTADAAAKWLVQAFRHLDPARRNSLEFEIGSYWKPNSFNMFVNSA